MIRGQFDVSSSSRPLEYIPSTPSDFEYVDQCDPSIADSVAEQCQSARDLWTACCDFIAGDLCGMLLLRVFVCLI